MSSGGTGIESRAVVIIRMRNEDQAKVHEVQMVDNVTRQENPLGIISRGMVTKMTIMTTRA